MITTYVDTREMTDEELFEYALAELPDGLVELALEDAPRRVVTDSEIAAIDDSVMKNYYGFDDEDIALLRLPEEGEMGLPADEWLHASLAREHMLAVNQAIDYRPKKPESRGMPSLDWSPKENWVDRKGVMKSSGDRGLPEYISRLAKQFTYRLKLGRQTAIKWAIGIARRWCETGFVRKSGKGQLNPGSRSQACAAIKQWEMMKARPG